MNTHQHPVIAGFGLGTSWVLWIVANIAQINEWLQGISLCLAIVASIGAIKYYFFTK